MDGTGTAGSASTVSRGDHQHPRDTSLLAIGRNRLHNPLFTVVQRGAGAFTSNGYTADRWYQTINLDTISTTISPFSDAQRVTIGDEEAVSAIVAAVAGNSGAAAFSFLAQNIESVRKLSNKTITVSFWAYATSGAPQVGVGFRQVFGTGGSPSSSVDVNAQAVTLSTTLTRYTVQISVPSASGKTFGTTAGTDYNRLAFFFSSGSTNNTLAGGIGVQSATFVLWGVQLEVGTAATPVEKRDVEIETAMCQRFYQTGSMYLSGYAAASLATIGAWIPFGTTMRATPTMAQSGLSYSNSGNSATATSATPMGFEWNFITGASGQTAASGNFTASADL